MLGHVRFAVPRNSISNPAALELDRHGSRATSVTRVTVDSHPARLRLMISVGVWVQGRCPKTSQLPALPKAPTEMRTIMAQVTDSSSMPIEPELRPADIHTEARNTASFTAETGLDIECCSQALDPSHSLTVSHIGDCNLECSFCAVRWSARRLQNLQGS
jgi:hypothetical protein